MRTLQLYQTEADELELVKAAFAEDCWLVPDSHYRAPEVLKLFNLEEFKHARIEQRHFFIMNETFLKSPLSMRGFSKQNESLYYVSPNEGGPFLEFLGGGVFAVDGVMKEQRIRPGFLECPRDYWDPAASQKRLSPPELAETFNRIVDAVKARSTRIKPGKTVFWLGADAKLKLQRGARLVGYETWLQEPVAPTSPLSPAAKTAP